jgi:hypothetical protein
LSARAIRMSRPCMPRESASLSPASAIK